MLHAWSLPSNNNGQLFYEFPELSTQDIDTLKQVEWWDAKLAGTGLKVVAGGRTEFRLNDKPGWFGL